MKGFNIETNFHFFFLPRTKVPSRTLQSKVPAAAHSLSLLDSRRSDENAAWQPLQARVDIFMPTAAKQGWISSIVSKKSMFCFKLGSRGTRYKYVKNKSLIDTAEAQTIFECVGCVGNIGGLFH